MDCELSVELQFLEQNISTIKAIFTEGQLTGDSVQVHLCNDQILSAKVKQGILHGPASIFGLTLQLPLAEEYSRDNETIFRAHLSPGETLGGLLNYENGEPVGSVWIGTIGGGFLHGKLDENFELTGEDIAYVYPDHSTAYYGRFENKVK